MSPHPDTAAAPTEVPVRRGRLPLTLEYPPATPRPPRDTTPSLVTPDPRSVGPRPVALALLWFALMAPLAFAARYAQATWGLGGDAVPLVMAAPALAAIACLAAVPGWFPRRIAPARAPVVLGAAGIATLSVVAFAGVLATCTPGHGWSGALALVPGMVVGALAEEIGFRGVLYRAMADRWRQAVVIPANGLIFGLCHLQYLDAGVGPVLLFVGSAVLLDVAMVAAWTGSWTQRVLIATVVHAGVNLALAFRGADGPGDMGALFLATAAAAAVACGARLAWTGFRRPSPRR